MTARKTAREAARSRTPLDGADAQALEGALTMTEQERDAAIAERDAAIARCRTASQTIIAEIGAVGPEDVEESARRAVVALRAAIAERDRLRRELEALLGEWSASALDPDAVHCRIDTILRGGES